ncbi:MAG: 23S rRNA (adenine(2503)-C(2))-methyltransferase RlmN [Pseudomonadota bacterium]|nr:23S rRNA (adenine(2503)-C(2))-methyltransferase RlmN [Pseudomonadota bacterium]
MTDLTTSAAAPLVRTPAVFAPPPQRAADGRLNLVGLSHALLADEMAALGEKPFRAKQLWHWIYYRGVTDFDEITNLSRAFRATLTENFVIGRPLVTTTQLSADGTRKWLLRLVDGHEVECVYIPESDRGTLCISSQVGCTLTCRFCHTGTQKLVRNLDAAEIVGQIMLARDTLGEWPSPKQGRMLSNIVVMGMGEPLYNFDAVAQALDIAMDPEGIAISKRRITLSTAGVVPMMAPCGDKIGVNLAVSLHATDDALRDELVPLNRKYPIAELMQACRDYPAGGNTRRITFEYIMLNGVNDSPAQARALVKLIAGIPAKVNLIPFNPWPGAPYLRSSNEAIATFAAIVNKAGYSSPVRVPRGEDIMAACGQLKSASERAKKARKTEAG